jgi:hypothetical protein
MARKRQIRNFRVVMLVNIASGDELVPTVSLVLLEQAGGVKMSVGLMKQFQKKHQ